MKSFLILIVGFVAGIFATFLFLYLKSDADQSHDGLIGLTKFSEKGECIPIKKALSIFQVVEPNMALAETGNYPDEIMVLLINFDGKSYYDNQKIIVPAKRCARQIGTYQYRTRMGIDKTVPAVVIE